MPDGAGGISDEDDEKHHIRCQMTLLELVVTCVAQSARDFFLAQAPMVIEALRPHLWRANSVEPALHCVLRLLRGCYHPAQPYWVAGEDAIATSGARAASSNEANQAELGRYSVEMYPGESTRSNLMRLAHIQNVLFPGWAPPRSTIDRAVNGLAESPVGDLMRAAGIGNLTELPHATQLVEVLAEVIVCMASHAVQWAVEEVIVPFLKFRKRSDASARTRWLACARLG